MSGLHATCAAEGEGLAGGRACRRGGAQRAPPVAVLWFALHARGACLRDGLTDCAGDQNDDGHDDPDNDTRPPATATVVVTGCPDLWIQGCGGVASACAVAACATGTSAAVRSTGTSARATVRIVGTSIRDALRSVRAAALLAPRGPSMQVAGKGKGKLSLPKKRARKRRARKLAGGGVGGGVPFHSVSKSTKGIMSCAGSFRTVPPAPVPCAGVPSEDWFVLVAGTRVGGGHTKASVRWGTGSPKVVSGEAGACSFPRHRNSTHTRHIRLLQRLGRVGT